MRIPQCQPFDRKEIEKERDAPEKPAKAEHELVPVREEMLLGLHTKDRDEEEPHDAAEEGHLPGRHVRQPLGAGRHEGEGQRREDRGDDPHGDAALVSLRGTQCHLQTAKWLIIYIFLFHMASPN